MDCESCLWIFSLAHRHNCINLLEAAVKFVGSYFTTLNKDNFLQLDLQELTTILSSDKLMVSSELDVYHLAHRWWTFHSSNYSSLPDELTKVIRLPLMSPEELQEVKEEFLRELSPVVSHMGMQLRQGMFEDKIICMDMMDQEECTNDFYLDSYDPVTEVWEKLPFPKFLLNSGVLSVGRYLYVSGGVNNENTVVRSLYVFDSLQNDWTQLSPMTVPRCNHGFVVHNQRLYALGGWDGSETTDSAEYYSVPESCWKTMCSLPMPLHCFGSVQFKGKLYLFGALTKQKNSPIRHLGFFLYDIISETWTQFPLKMQLASAVSVSLGDRLLVIGGYTSNYSKYHDPFPPRSTNQCYGGDEFYVPPCTSQFYDYFDVCSKPGFNPTISFCLDSAGRFCHCPVPSLPENFCFPKVARWKQRIYVLAGDNRKECSHMYHWSPGDSVWTCSKKELPIYFCNYMDCATVQFPMERFHFLFPDRKPILKRTSSEESSEVETNW